MWPFPTILMQWEEADDVETAHRTWPGVKRMWWLWLYLLLAAVLTFWLVRFLVLGAHPHLLEYLTVLLAFVIGLIEPWFVRRFLKSKVIVWSTGIAVYRGAYQWSSVFSKLKSFVLEERDGYQVLEITMHNDHQEKITVPRSVDSVELADLLSRNGLMRH